MTFVMLSKGVVEEDEVMKLKVMRLNNFVDGSTMKVTARCTP